jgi:hypothetical protein
MAVDVMPVRAGDILTAHGYNLAKPAYAWKTASESVTSSTALQDDDELALPVEPFSVYLLLACYSVSGPTGADIKISFTVPTGAQGRRHNLGLSTPATSTTGNSRISVHGLTNTATYGTTSTPVSIIEEGVIGTEALGGVLQAQWAQVTSNATATVVEASSFMRLQRVL